MIHTLIVQDKMSQVWDEDAQWYESQWPILGTTGLGVPADGRSIFLPLFYEMDFSLVEYRAGDAISSRDTGPTKIKFDILPESNRSPRAFICQRGLESYLSRLESFDPSPYWLSEFGWRKTKR